MAALTGTILAILLIVALFDLPDATLGAEKQLEVG
jgi:hypothetical protein